MKRKINNVILFGTLRKYLSYNNKPVFSIALVSLVLLLSLQSYLSAENSLITKLPHGYLQKVQDWNIYEGSNRDNWQKPFVLLSLIKDISNKTIADLGSGPGYLTVRAAPFAKKVIAVDISDSHLNYLKRRMKKLEKNFPIIKNRVLYRKADTNSPNLKRGEVDYIITINTFHHLSDHVNYFQKVKRALKSGGQIIIVDFTTKDRPIGPSNSHGIIAKKKIIRLMQQAGYAVEDKKSLLPYHNVLVCTPN